MGNTHRPKHPLDGGIYTLGQSRTNNISDNSQITNKMVHGKGSDLSDKAAWQGRAKRKLITQRLMLALVDVAKQRGDLKQRQRYWNAYHCQSNIVCANSRSYGSYCKTRYCLICASIRKAEIINKYLPVISTWEDPHFVTITVKSVKDARLKFWFKCMKIAFARTKDRINKRHQRGKGIMLVGIKSLECNFNPIKKTYNPHYHLIVANKQMALTLKKEWRKTWNKKQFLASYKAQHHRCVKNVEADLVEVIKYGSKIFTDPTMKKGRNKVPPIIYAAAMDNIFRAMEDHRLFDRFGFNLPKSDPQPKAKPTFLQNYEDIFFDSFAKDWVNYETGELLTGFTPNAQLEFLLNNHINTNTT